MYSDKELDKEKSKVFTKNNLFREYLNLFIISFIALYFEVLLIRWLATEIRIFAYFKNFVLIASFFGLGLGCANKNKDFSLKAVPWLFLILSLIVIFSEDLHITKLFFPDPTLYQWKGSIISPNLINALSQYPLFSFLIGKIPNTFVLLLSAAICLGVTYLIFYLVVAFFYFLGKELGRLIDIGDPLIAYSINIFGSLVGIIIFTTISFFNLPPPVWLLVGFLPFLLFRKRIVYIFIFSVVILFSIIFATGRNTIWSPYYRIDYHELKQEVKSGESLKAGYIINVDYDYTERALNLSNDFTEKIEKGLIVNAKRYYDLPYLLASRLDNVLIIGSGSGNDVAAALRNNAKNVEAVEIDPQILRLGKRIHPEQPYLSPRVKIINNDGRAYMQQAAKDSKKYDLIVFGLVDSLAALSSLSTVRLEFFMHTTESIKQALDLLDENGLLAITFSVGWKDWIAKRLFNTYKKAYKQNPICIDTTYYDSSIMYLMGPAAGTFGFINKIRALDESIVTHQFDQSNIRTITDDWPFLYNTPKTFPLAYVLSILIILCSGVILVKKKIFYKGQTSSSFNWHMFFMGAAFLLLETKNIITLSLLFGNTWIVNSIVFASILVIILFANYINKVINIKSYTWLYVLLGISFVITYAFPFSILNYLTFIQRAILGGFITALPLFFAAMIFANIFKKAKVPHIYLGSNILGALFGGTIEATSLAIGIKNLLIIAAMFYIFSYLCLMKRKGSGLES